MSFLIIQVCNGYKKENYDACLLDFDGVTGWNWSFSYFSKFPFISVIFCKFSPGLASGLTNLVCIVIKIKLFVILYKKKLNKN